MLENFVAWGQLLSSGAVLITLIYLSVQTRQTNSAIRASARQSQYELDLNNLFELTNNADLPVKLAKDEVLCEVDQMRMTFLWMAALRHAELLSIQYRSGVIDQNTWDSQRRIIAAYLSTQRMRNWWNSAGRLPFSPEFVAIVDQTLSENLVPDDYQQRMFTWDSGESLQRA